MSDELLPYYNRELSFIRRLGAEFAEANPKIAARLRLGPDTSEDPHVERLIEAFAYLAARIRHKVEDDFPELTDALLGVLYPHYLAPVPSMSIVQMSLDPAQGEIPSGYTVDRGAGIETEPIQGEPCRFQTCYPVTLWPVQLSAATLSRPPFVAPSTRHTARAAAVLRMLFKSLSPKVNFSAMPPGSLRFYLKGQAQHVYQLYELLLNNTLGVALANSPRDPDPILLGPECVRAVGFEQDEGMLPYSARSFLGYRLLTELFVFREKFLFFDLTGLSREKLAGIGNQLEVYLYLNRTSPDLEQNVSADTFRLGCTPMVNLFRQRAEPIQLTHTEPEYRVVPDARRALATEVYSIDGVTATSPDGQQIEFLPFYSLKHAAERRGDRPFWFATRRPAGRSERQPDYGTEVYLSVVDLAFRPSAPADWTISVETTCLNRDLPHHLPYGGDQLRLQFSEGAAAISRITCLTQPTPTFRPARKHGALWKLISHLSLNHLSLVNGEGGADALREILKLYDFADSDETRSMIDGVLNVRSRRVVGRVMSDNTAGFCRGIETRIELDEERFAGSGLFLFASVLERFLSLYCSVNSFSKMIVTTKQREGELRRWTPRAGERALL